MATPNHWRVQYVRTRDGQVLEEKRSHRRCLTAEYHKRALVLGADKVILTSALTRIETVWSRHEKGHWTTKQLQL